MPLMIYLILTGCVFGVSNENSSKKGPVNENSSDSGEPDTSPSYSGDSEDSGDSGNNDRARPVVLSVRVNCDSAGSAGEILDVSVTVDDPQGASTVANGQMFVLDLEGIAITGLNIPCGGSQCAGSLRLDRTGNTCDSTSSVRIYVTDRDGNISETSDHPTR